MDGLRRELPVCVFHMMILAIFQDSFICEGYPATIHYKSMSDDGYRAGQKKGQQQLPWLVTQWTRLTDYLSSDFLGGPKQIRLADVVNFQKGATVGFCIALMALSGNTSQTALVYTALHGSYGLAWLLKEVVFPDPKWQVKITWGSAVGAVLLVLGPYWVMPYLTIVGRVDQNPVVLCVATLVYVIGLLLMFGSDCQKYFVLREKKGLITTGFFRHLRHPNYLGEMMLYGSFAAVSGSWISWGILSWVWLGLFVPNMMRKEASMSRYPQWHAYTRSSWALIPGVI